MSALAANASFTDVPENAWFYEPVTYMAENGYMSGTGGKFSPNQTTTRAMFVTVLGRIAGVDQNQYKNTCTFRDVKKDWAEPYIAWAAENKIVNGLGDNKFGPNNYVTREQAALILFNYLKRDYTLTVSDEFLNKACATMLGGSWEVATLEASAGFDWGVTYYPVSDETGAAVSPCGDWSAAITKGCEYPDEAGQFLQWLMSTDNVATYCAAVAKPATRASAYDHESMAAYKEGPRALFVEQLQNTAVPRPPSPS